eukprot:461149_1
MWQCENPFSTSNGNVHKIGPPIMTFLYMKLTNKIVVNPLVSVFSRLYTHILWTHTMQKIGTIIRKPAYSLFINSPAVAHATQSFGRNVTNIHQSGINTNGGCHCEYQSQQPIASVSDRSGLPIVSVHQAIPNGRIVPTLQLLVERANTNTQQWKYDAYAPKDIGPSIRDTIATTRNVLSLISGGNITGLISSVLTTPEQLSLNKTKPIIRLKDTFRMIQSNQQV